MREAKEKRNVDRGVARTAHRLNGGSKKERDINEPCRILDESCRPHFNLRACKCAPIIRALEPRSPSRSGTDSGHLLE